MGQAPERRVTVVAKERIDIPPLERRAKERKAKGIRAKERRKMSSPKKRRTQGFNRGKKNDPEGEGVEDEEMRSLVGRTLGTTLGVEEDEGIEQLLRDSAEKGLRLRQDREGLEVEKKRSSDMQLSLIHI